MVINLEIEELIVVFEHRDIRNHELGHASIRELGGSQTNELDHGSLCELDPVSYLVEMSVATPKTLTAERHNAK